MLSLGSNSSLRVVQHDAASQQTSLEMDAGKLRSKVVKITQPNGKFEVHTPNAVIGVVGTDFFVQYDNNRTTIVCYSGLVKVTPQGGAQVQRDFVRQRFYYGGRRADGGHRAGYSSGGLGLAADTRGRTTFQPGRHKRYGRCPRCGCSEFSCATQPAHWSRICWRGSWNHARYGERIGIPTDAEAAGVPAADALPVNCTGGALGAATL
jgi:hypothetical protein